MQKDLAQTLERAIELYNSKQADESQHLDWWEVLDAIEDIEDNKQVANAVALICKMAGKRI